VVTAPESCSVNRVLNAVYTLFPSEIEDRPVHRTYFRLKFDCGMSRARFSVDEGLQNVGIAVSPSIQRVMVGDARVIHRRFGFRAVKLMPVYWNVTPPARAG